MGWRQISLAMLPVWAISSCSAPSAFQCQSDVACGGVNGQCELSGYCSFPSETCESGREYAALAGSLSGQCVPPGPSGSGGSSGGTSTTTTTTGTSGSSGTTDPSTTTAVTGETTSDSTGGETGGEAIELCSAAMQTVIEERFDVVPTTNAVWDQTADPGATAAAVEGVLQISIDIDGSEGDAAFWWLKGLSELPRSGIAGVEVLIAPDVGDPGEATAAINDNVLSYAITVIGGELKVVLGEPGGMFTELTAQPWNPGAHRWMRIRWDGMSDTIDFETSADAQTWSSVFQVSETGFDYGDAFFEMGAGVWSAPFVDDPYAAFDNAFLCED